MAWFLIISMNVLMVSSETVPFSKSGGLADVIGALSFALAKTGTNVKVLMPMYSFIDKKGFKKGQSFKVEMLGAEEEVSTCSKTVENVEFVGLVHPYFTKRKGIYGDTSFTPYPDNAERFSLFSLSVLPYLEASGFDADIIHCHDWTTGLVPYIVKLNSKKIKTVYTIHNLAYQGEASRYDVLLSGLPLRDELFTGTGLSSRFNMMKTGISFADKVTTVSPTYAKEITSKEQGCSLEWLLKEREEDLSGIINGIDYKEWNPEKDKFFTPGFSAKNLKNKQLLKEEVMKEFGLKRPELPLISMISRLADQKGFQELLSGSPSLLENMLDKNNSNFIIIGTGDKRFEDKLIELDGRYENLSARIVFSNEVAHRVEGGSDFFLMPSRYEPCGLNQMYSLHYGTLPIAHETGGLKDTIVDITSDKVNGQGFLFKDMNPEEMEKAVDRAVDFYNSAPKKEIEEARKRGMMEDFTWVKSASLYNDLYNSIAN